MAERQTFTPEIENKADVRRVARVVYNQRNKCALDELLDSDGFVHEAMPKLQHRINGLKETIRWVSATFPDLYYDIEYIVSEVDEMMTRLTFRGPRAREFWGIRPSETQIAIQHVH